MRKILIGLFIFGFLAISTQVYATSANATSVISENQEQLVCCESFGYGAYMVKTSSSYEMMLKSKCNDVGLFGGGKNIVNSSFCKSEINTPVISGVSGPQSLNVNQTGTWTIKASSSNEGNLSYSVNWGDEAYKMSTTSAVKNALETQQSATFTHTYSRAGTYTPTFTVTSENTIRCVTTPCPSNGGSAKTSLSVKVGNLTNICPIIMTDCVVGYSPVVSGKDSNGCDSWSCKKDSEPDEGCLPGYNYSPKTGQKCSGVKDNDGCLVGYNYSPKTGKACSNITSTTTTVAPQSSVSQTSTTSSSGESSSTSIKRTLKKGIKGDDVKILQLFLNLAADGSFGPQTQAKVMEWQAQNGLKVDGAFGIQSAEKAGLAE